MHKHSYTNTLKSHDKRHHGQKPGEGMGKAGLTLGALVMSYAAGRVNAMKTESHGGTGKLGLGSLGG